MKLLSDSVCEVYEGVYVYTHLVVHNLINLHYLRQVGSECGTWPESGWLVDQVTMGLAFFSPSRYLSHFTLGYLAQA